MYEKEIQKAEMYFGDIMFEEAMTRAGGDDNKALEELDKGFDNDTQRNCMFEALMTAGIKGNGESLKPIVDEWCKNI